jgi:hypothetical protein
MLVVYLVIGGAPHAYAVMPIAWGQLWCYVHGHAHRHESVWMVPGVED